jgi:hypothetical protein
MFEMLNKNIWANFQRIIELFTQKIVTKLSKIWVWDPGSGKKPIPDPGSRGQKGTGSRIRNTGNRIQYFSLIPIRIRIPNPDPDPPTYVNPDRIRILSRNSQIPTVINNVDSSIVFRIK